MKSSLNKALLTDSYCTWSLRPIKTYTHRSTERRGLLHAIGQWRLFHRAVHWLGVYAAANWLLHRLPRIRKLPIAGSVIRIRSVAGLALAEEMLDGNAYASLANIRPLTTFIDLGCNVGWFPCLLREHGTASPVGLLVDADPAMVDEANWHMATNNIAASSICGAAGVAGSRDGNKSVTFHVNPANTSSSLTPFSGGHPFPVKGRIRTLTVRAIAVGREWHRLFGDRTVDVLKVDIEGAEFEFLRYESGFIAEHVRYILCEWHSWHGTLSELQAILEQSGFELVEVTQQDANGGVALFQNTRHVTAA